MSCPFLELIDCDGASPDRVCLLVLGNIVRLTYFQAAVDSLAECIHRVFGI